MQDLEVCFSRTSALEMFCFQIGYLDMSQNEIPKYTLPKFNMEPKNDGFQVRNLLYLSGASYRFHVKLWENGNCLTPHSPTTGQNHCQRSPIRPQEWLARWGTKGTNYFTRNEDGSKQWKTKLLHTGTEKNCITFFMFQQILWVLGIHFRSIYSIPPNI